MTFCASYGPESACPMGVCAYGGRTVFRLTSRETKDEGKLTKQFFKLTRDISAATDWPPRPVGAIAKGKGIKE